MFLPGLYHIFAGLTMLTVGTEAVSYFYTGALIGPTIGPLVGGIIVTYASWRDVFWLQTGLAGVGVVAPFLLLSETLVPDDKSKKVILSKIPHTMGKARYLARMTSPLRPINLLLRSPNLILVALGSGSLVWNQYSLLTPIRYVLNPRFHLSSPLVSGLFYLAPGTGYVLGTLGGGRWADYVVKRWITKREGRRVAEDRLRSCVGFMGVVIPASMLVYGWSVDKAVGGIALPVVFMFLQGVAQSFCFPSLNTYCLDAAQARNRSAESVRTFSEFSDPLSGRFGEHLLGVPFAQRLARQVSHRPLWESSTDESGRSRGTLWYGTYLAQ